MIRGIRRICLSERLLPSLCHASFHCNGSLLQNYYDTLGVSKTASQEEIKTAYFKLCKEYHPDKHDNNATKSNKFLKINDAYNVLGNTESRQEYDNTLLRRPLRSESHYYHEKWSSAYQSNPYSRNQWTGSQNRDDFNRNRANEYTRRHRDNLDRYWDEYYRHQRSWKHAKMGSFSSPQWLGADRVVSFFLVFIVTILMMRFMAAGLAWRSRSQMQELELQRHLEVRRKADEARERMEMYQEQSKLQNSELIPKAKLEDA